MDPLQLQVADLIFIRGTRWLDFPVKLVTQSQYTHVAGYVGEHQLIEAQSFRNTGYLPSAAYAGAADVFRYPRLTSSQAARIVRFARHEVGSHYDYLLLGWEFFRLSLGIVLPYMKNKRRICSTLWADAFTSAGIALCPTLRYPTPGDLTRSGLLRKVGSLEPKSISRGLYR